MKRKIVIIGLIGTMIFSMVACGRTTERDNTSTNTTKSSSNKKTSKLIGKNDELGNENINLVDGGHVCYKNDWLFFSVDGTLFKSRQDGSEMSKIYEFEGDDEYKALHSINVIKDWIYFSGGSDSLGTGLYKIKTDGTKFQKILSDEKSGDVIVEGNYIYYKNMYKLSCNNDGSDKEKLKNTDLPTSNCNYLDGYFYYCTREDINTDDYHIYKSTVLHQVLELGVEDDYLRYNPSDNALKELKKARNFETEKRRALTVTEQELFEKFLSRQGQYHRWYPIFTIMLWTGMRVGEITGLRWCDIDLEEEIINVNHTLVYYSTRTEAGQIFAINTTKTKAGERTIPMLPIVKEAFLMEKKYQEECGIKSVAVVDGYRDFIFVNRFGNVQHQGTLNKALRRIIRDCNFEVLDKEHGEDVVILPKFSNHSLRHTFTTRMCEAGVNIKAMQEILGHADAETTMDIYAEATKDLKKSELINFEDYFAKQKKVQSGN